MRCSRLLFCRSRWLVNACPSATTRRATTAATETCSIETDMSPIKCVPSAPVAVKGLRFAPTLTRAQERAPLTAHPLRVFPSYEKNVFFSCSKNMKAERLLSESPSELWREQLRRWSSSCSKGRGASLLPCGYRLDNQRLQRNQPSPRSQRHCQPACVEKLQTNLCVRSSSPCGQDERELDEVYPSSVQAC